MRRILLIIKNDVKRRLKSPVAILVLIAIPLLMTTLVGSIFGPKSDDSNQLLQIKVLIVDNDKNIASRFLLSAFDAEEMKEMFQVTMVEESEGRKLIGKGKASALIIIPDKFTENIGDGIPTEFTLIKNPGEQFMPRIVEEFMNTMAVVVSGFVQVFQPEIKAVKSMLDSPLENLAITDMTPFMEQSKDKILALKKYLDPLLLKLKSEIAGKEKKEEQTDSQTATFNIFGMLLPAMSIMFLLFIIEIFIRDILSEREDGKLRRMMFSPLKTSQYIMARICSGWVMGIIVYAVIVVFGLLLFRIQWGNYFYLFIFVAVTSFWIAAFFALLNAFFKNRNQAGAWIAPIILVFSAFGGSMLPVQQLPGSIRWISLMTLNQWFIRGTADIAEGVFPLAPAAVILATGLIFFFLASVFLKKRLTA